MSADPVRPAPDRIPLNTFAIAFGLAGLAEVWSTVCDALGWPGPVGQIAWVVAAVAWVWLIVAHLVRGSRSATRLAQQLRHPAQGPIAALVPVTGMLLGADLDRVVPIAGTVLVLVCIAAAVVFASWLIGIWFEGGLELAAVHGGYLLPTVAGGLVAADAAARIHLVPVGWAMFGIGVFFWAVMMTLLVLRLTVSPALPEPLVPTMAILIAPPAVGGIAWFGLAGSRVEPVGLALAGLTVLSTGIQIALVGRYRRLRFSLGFWSFTFPIAAVVAMGIMWLHLIRPPGWPIAAIGLAVAFTAFVGTIAVRSLRLIDWRRGVEQAEAAITRADDDDARIPAPREGSTV